MAKPTEGQILRANILREQLRPLVKPVGALSARQVADEIGPDGPSNTAISAFLNGRALAPENMDQVDAWIAKRCGNGDTRDAPTKGGRAPSSADLGWLPDLLREIVRMPELTGAERQGLMAEVNAAAMRYWALAAEWSSGQRGLAMTRDAEASGERAGALREAGRPRTPGGRPVTEEEMLWLEEIRAKEAAEGARREAGGN